MGEWEVGALQGFFAAATLASVRVAGVERFGPWPMERLLARAGYGGLLASHIVAGMALIDTVVIVQPIERRRGLSSLSLLFHELVHIEQYRLLGTRGFVREYVRGWVLGGRSYMDIPLEEQAYRLTAKYECDPSLVFSVAEAVRSELQGRISDAM